MEDKKYPQSGLPIRKSSDLLPGVFRTEANEKFLAGTLDPLVQPGALEKTVGYIGRRYGKTFTGSDVYLDSDETLRSRYQLEPAVTVKENGETKQFFDYLDLKNQLAFFGNISERDDNVTLQEHYSWSPPVDWDKFVNYREYYWAPQGPPSVAVRGQAQAVTSEYRVNQDTTQSSWIFTPDGFTNNPTIQLYRGQTYKFKVNSPGEGFVIRSNYDTGSLYFDPNRTYFAGEIALFDGKLWKAKVEISPLDGSTITVDSQDWELIDSNPSAAAFDFSEGVTNNGVQQGEVVFEVPLDAPDKLYYQSTLNPDRLGIFLIADIEANTFIDVENEIIGKVTYTSSNDVAFTNGLVIEFRGNVSPEQYSEGTWLVDGVGDEITLTRFDILIPPNLDVENPEITFDDNGFDTQPFDDASLYPGTKDYITIAKNSKDLNPWSRYNRWFHRSVLEYANKIRGQEFEAEEDSRAKRPIIEFAKNLVLFNHGETAKQSVDFVDDFTTDVLSNIEGQIGYSVDGVPLFNGARLLVIADTDPLTNNKIYEVQFITHNGKRQIHLEETVDTDSVINEGVFVKRGTSYSGKMFHFTGTSWIPSQEKTDVNQPPKFNIFDEQGVSFADDETYPVSTFAGSNILQYRLGSGPADREIGFPISYLNINNVGDIQFDWAFENDVFTYEQNQTAITTRIETGYYKVGNTFANGWVKTNNDFVQPIIDSFVIDQQTDTIEFATVDWKAYDLLPGDTEETPNKINFYLNGEKIDTEFTRIGGSFTFDRTFAVGDVVSIKIVADIAPDTGYYQIPVGLEKNPLNQSVDTFTLGQASDHVKSALEFYGDFTGALPGVSNLRDISGYTENANRFMKHAGLGVYSIPFLCDKTNNIVKSINFAKQSYTGYIDSFLKKAEDAEQIDNIPDLCDTIINQISETSFKNAYFANSDMIGSGAHTKIQFEVKDVGIKTIALSSSFDLNGPSNTAVYLYKNNQQLVHGADYEFDSDFGFARLLIDLVEGDLIEVREYISSSASFLPPTPTSMGMYKKYKPEKFIDDTYVNPLEVIQGHDGSHTIAFGDYRDDLLLELELRIYNNIKIQYDPVVFDIDELFAGYNKNGVFNKEEFDNVINKEFLRFVKNLNLNYTNNLYFESENSFTYTYSNLLDPGLEGNLPGWWRGVYQWAYDTDRPHTRPWEMLGFSEKPTWWEAEYGPAPYTRGNLILWEDLSQGRIRQGDRAGVYPRYERQYLLNNIPVDDQGQLLSPLDSGFAKNFSLVNNQGSFKLGDISPAEHTWRRSSQFPFAVMIALSVYSPFGFIVSSLDKTATKRNRLDQLVSKTSNVFIQKQDLTDNTATQKAGLINYLDAYIKSRGLDGTEFDALLENLDVNLTSRLSGFVDKQQQRYLLDSKSPSSTSESVFIPPENYEIYFNESSPTASVSYSGVIVEKSSTGFIINGYDDINPYFNYYEAVANQLDPGVSIGGVSEEFVNWAPNQFYTNGVIALFDGVYFRAIRSHTSGETFDTAPWQRLDSLPLVGGAQAKIRRNFDRRRVQRLSYGTAFDTIQEVVDFLLGYGEYLESFGFVFNRYNYDTLEANNWTTSAKEFLFWTLNNWSEGALITLSPSANYFEINNPVGVPENLLDPFFEYNVLTADGRTLDPRFINVKREFRKTVITTTEESNDGIYFLNLNYVLKEHVAVFSDRTVFNDVIYDKATGYRQERIKNQGFRTVDWDGDYTSPGFLFDNVDIKVWQPFADYKLGDIVAYRSYNWVSLQNQEGTLEFDDTKWSILDTEPQKQLIGNFDFKINGFEDYFEPSSSGINENKKELARHTIGYQQRDYLQNLASDPITQLNLYRGFIQDKGTQNVVEKVFEKFKDQNRDDPAVELFEEWAIKTGELGGTDQSTEYEIRITQDQILLDPQPLLIDLTGSANVNDGYIRVNQSDFSISPVPLVQNINSVSFDSEPAKTAGYVKSDQVEYIFKDKAEVAQQDITRFRENDHVWLTFDNNSWSVLRFNIVPELVVEQLELANSSVTLIFNRKHNFSIGDIVGFVDIANLKGLYIVSATSRNGVTVTAEYTQSTTPELDPSTINRVYRLAETRYTDFDQLNPEEGALLATGSKLFVDQDENNRWTVYEKQRQYAAKKIANFGITQPLRAGAAVKYDPIRKTLLCGIPGSGFVANYVENGDGLDLLQILPNPAGLLDPPAGAFGKALALSPDGKFLAVGAPNASGIRSYYQGPFDPDETYLIGDIVLYQGKLFEAVNRVEGDGSTLDSTTEDWKFPDIIQATVNATHPGFSEQGFVTIYEYANQQWNEVISFVSPRPGTAEFFGQDLSFAKVGNNYRLAVSAPGSLSGTGRVYLFEYDGSSWKHLQNQRYRGVYNPGADFTGNISFDVALGRYILTVESVMFGVIEEGLTIEGLGILPNTVVGAFISGTKNGPGIYEINKAQTVGTTNITGTMFYPQGSIVWSSGSLWQAVSDVYSDGSSSGIDNDFNDWLEIDRIATQNSLPTSVALSDDGSTLAAGILDPIQTAELVKSGDAFGTSLSFNYDGSVLIVGAPYSDEQFFANYRGVWRGDYEYIEGDVVKFEGTYHKLVDDGSLGDSSIRSYNQEPVGAPWQNIGDSTNTPTGKVFVYSYNENGYYSLAQTISAENVINDDSANIRIDSGDDFGFELDLDNAGTTLVVASPKADINETNQGSAYIFTSLTAANPEFRLIQQLQSFEKYPNEFFGQSVKINSDTSKIVIGATNARYSISTLRFDESQTVFDSGRTSFYERQGFAGSAYVFDLKDGRYFLTEKLQSDLSLNESFGFSVDVSGDIIAVGSPEFAEIDITDNVISFSDDKTGTARLFRKDTDKESWNIIGQQVPSTDINKVKKIELYDEENDLKLADLEVLDHAKLSILSEADKEIKFKVPYDPATYTVGTQDQVVDPQTAWTEKHVGQLWWDLSTAKWIHYEQGNLAYRTGNWNTLAYGASIDVYEWVESKYLPSEWNTLTGTAEGFAEGITGTPLYADDSVYSQKELFNLETRQPTETKYYYWVVNKVNVPAVPGRSISASQVANLIANPASLGNTFISLVDANKFLLWNFREAIESDTALLNLEYYKTSREDQNLVHNEYLLLSEGVATSLPSDKIETKWIDSLVGYDADKNRIPDPQLPDKQKYGIKFRPRQTMFVDRFSALEIVVDRINNVLSQKPFALNTDLTLFNSVDEPPSELFNFYDEQVDTFLDLQNIGTARTRQAILSANLIDGELDTIDIVDPGFGYKVPPPVEFEGDGQNASAEVSIDNQGRITSVTVTRRGKKYSTLIAKVRRFSVLVLSDENAAGSWGIYAWDDVRKVYFRSRSQAFDTTKYWNYIDWYDADYDLNTPIKAEIELASQEPGLEAEIGDVIRIKEYGSGGWALLQKTSETADILLENYTLIARQNGTIAVSQSTYDRSISLIGYDRNESFDSDLYDIENSRELRNILQAVKEEIFVDEYAAEWNKLFFASLRYVFTEQTYVDWAFKTSFVNAKHNVDSLRQKLNYKNDNLQSYLDYINEVKPFRTSIREYISEYAKLENSSNAISDFDLPSYYDSFLGKVVTTSSDQTVLDQYPWKWWADNKGYAVTDIVVTEGGTGYTNPPRVLITGSGTGTTAQAFISNGSVISVRVLTTGNDYLSAPTVTLVGGNSNADVQAKAVAIIGQGLARSFDLTMKFDRTSTVGNYRNLEYSQTIIASGNTAVFDLDYAPTRNKDNIRILKNKLVVFDSEYTITLFKDNRQNNSLLRGKITFVEAPSAGDEIVIEFDKNVELLDSVNRIQRHYDPRAGMKGDDLGQLMTGVDFGGVQVQGTTFDVTGGWDALPWFTDSWDSVEAASDFYVVADGSTTFVTLPYVPANGQEINIYLKREGSRVLPTIDDLQYSQQTPEPETVRIDDPNFGENGDSSLVTNDNAVMPTFVGDGSTNAIEIGVYINTEAGDILIFRPAESDGSVTITDVNLLDTRLSGGTLSAMNGAYSTANGITADEISIDGGEFNNPDHTPAPEENVPGQILDSVDITVFQNNKTGSATALTKVYIADGSQRFFDIGQIVPAKQSVLVYKDKELLDQDIDYDMFLFDNQIEILSAPANGSVIEVVSVGLGGIELLDYKEFRGDGEIKLYLTSANYTDTTSVFVSIDGSPIDLGFVNSSDYVDTQDKTLIEFSDAPSIGSTIRIIALGSALDTDTEQNGLVLKNIQETVFTGDRSVNIENFVELTRGSTLSSIIVEVNNRAIQGVDTVYEVYNGTNNNFVLGTDPLEPAGAILNSNIKVFVNDNLLTFIQDYVYEGTSKTLTIDERNLNQGDVIKIENDFRAQYSITGSNLVLDETVNISDNDIIKITWFAEYPSQKLISDEIVGGKAAFDLPVVPDNVSSVYVYLNGIRQTQDQDYKLSFDKRKIYLNENTTQSDLVKIIVFGTDEYAQPSAFQISKDMLNVYRYNAHSNAGIKLTKDLKYFDIEIYVDDASALKEPVPERNIPGRIMIGQEKIEYFKKEGNVLSQLRRGAQGSAIKEIHEVGLPVVDISNDTRLPYSDDQDRQDFVSDGSSLMIGPLNFTPSKSANTGWYRDTIPQSYGQSDELEVFVGGRRLQKSPQTVFDESLGAISPQGDKQQEAEFSVSGEDAFVRLTEAPPAGTRISVISKKGIVWYDRANGAVIQGVTLTDNTNPIAKFIASFNTELPE